MGFIESTSASTEAITGLFQLRVHRGLSIERDNLCIIDSSNGLYKSTREVFGKSAAVQNCQ